jgi:hypothetical protein
MKTTREILISDEDLDEYIDEDLEYIYEDLDEYIESELDKLYTIEVILSI